MARKNLRHEQESLRPWTIFGFRGELLEHAASPTPFQAGERTVAAPLPAAVAHQLANEVEEGPPKPVSEVQRAQGGQPRRRRSRASG